MQEPRKRAWLILLAVIGILAAALLGVSALLLSRWSDLRKATPQEAETAFAAALAGMESRSLYLEVSRDGTVHVHRELEQAVPSDLRTLHVLAWEPSTARLLRLDFPFWFVRLKMNRTLNLGTLGSVLARDWGSLDLQVSEDDLSRRGPGLVLAHALPNGARILLWTR